MRKWDRTSSGTGRGPFPIRLDISLDDVSLVDLAKLMYSDESEAITYYSRGTDSDTAKLRQVRLGFPNPTLLCRIIEGTTGHNVDTSKVAKHARCKLLSALANQQRARAACTKAKTE
jgi:hypothetical protein